MMKFGFTLYIYLIFYVCLDAYKTKSHELKQIVFTFRCPCVMFKVMLYKIDIHIHVYTILYPCRNLEFHTDYG